MPYWSLGYEVPYYAIVGLACFAPRRWRVFAVLATMAAVGPRVVSLFPVWLMGFAAHRISNRAWVGRRTGLALAAAAVLLLVAIDVVMRLLHTAVGDLFAPHNYRYLWIDYLIGLLIALHLIGVAAAPGGVGFLVRPFARAIHWLAGATFTDRCFPLSGHALAGGDGPGCSQSLALASDHPVRDDFELFRLGRGHRTPQGDMEAVLHVAG